MRPDDEVPPEARAPGFPSELVTVLVCAALTSVMWGLQVPRADHPAAGAAFASLALAAALAAFGVFRTWRVAWPWAVAVFAASAAGAVARGVTLGWNGARVGLLLMALGSLWILRAPAIRARFRSGRGAGLRGVTLLGWVADAVFLAATWLPTLALGLPLLVQIVVPIVAVVPWILWLRPRVVRRLGPWLVTTPRGLRGADARAFRAALGARGRGDVDAAEARLASLPPLRAVALLRDLCVMDRACRGSGFERLVFDAHWAPPADRVETLAAELPDVAWIDALLETRWRLLDGLVADATGDGLFLEEAEPLLERLTGQVHAAASVDAIVSWWREARAPEAERARAWLADRLLRAGAIRAADVYATRVNDGASAPPTRH